MAEGGESLLERNGAEELTDTCGGSRARPGCACAGWWGMFVGCGEQIWAETPVVSTCGYVPETEMMGCEKPTVGWQVSGLAGRLGQVMLSPLTGVPTRSFLPRILTREEGRSMDTSSVTHMC